MIWNILADKNHMPASRWPWRLIPIKNFALKTGTSDKKIGGKSYPKDGRMVLYTPEDVIISRAGNTNGSAMGATAYGGEMNAYVIRQYVSKLQEQ
jgi:hypothetical protein